MKFTFNKRIIRIDPHKLREEYDFIMFKQSIIYPKFEERRDTHFHRTQPK